MLDYWILMVVGGVDIELCDCLHGWEQHSMLRLRDSLGSAHENVASLLERRRYCWKTVVDSITRKFMEQTWTGLKWSIALSDEN